MKKTKYISEFIKQHNISNSANLKSISVSVECIREANELAFNHIAYIDNKTEEEGFVVHTHINLIGRLLEQAEGMLACIATNSPTSSEVLGRVVVEGSINLMFMSLKGNEKTILAFMKTWTNEHLRKLNEWKEKIKEKEYGVRVGKQIDARIEVVNMYELYVDTLIKNFSADESVFKNIWPKSLYKRFEAIEKEEAYYENYHRLSGSAHITAEDTLIFLMSLSMDDDQKVKLAEEAWAYSIMMSQLSSIIFIDALITCCIRHGLYEGPEFDRLLELKKNLSKEVEVISNAAGVPQI